MIQKMYLLKDRGLKQSITSSLGIIQAFIISGEYSFLKNWFNAHLGMF